MADDTLGGDGELPAEERLAPPAPPPAVGTVVPPLAVAGVTTPLA